MNLDEVVHVATARSIDECTIKCASMSLYVQVGSGVYLDEVGQAGTAHSIDKCIIKMSIDELAHVQTRRETLL